MTWIDCLAKAELGLEFFMSAFCFLCNMYFSARFAKITTFDNDLKVIFVILHLFKALLAIIHPVSEIIPKDWYSIDKQEYFGALCFYFLQYFHSICMYLVSIEYALIVFERKMAIHSFYSKKRVWKGRSVLYLTLTIIAIGLLIKCIIVYLIYKNRLPWKELLDIVFITDKNVASNSSTYIICYISAVYGLIEFIKLRRYIHKNWFNGKTLAESVQIKQTGVISKILMPISVSYCVLATMAGFGYFFSVYLHFYLGYSLYSPSLTAFVYSQYLCVSIYNLFSTVYIIWLLKPMRKMMLQDMFNFLGLRLVNRHKVKTRQINWSDEREQHFHYLKQAWQ